MKNVQAISVSVICYEQIKTDYKEEMSAVIEAQQFI